MSILTLSSWAWPAEPTTSRPQSPKSDWPLMGDVSTVRAGVPEALVQWRRARGEMPPTPCDPDLL